jgi:proline iminopeptidase
VEKTVEHKGVKLWTTSGGNGTPLVLFNGGPGCSDYLEPVSRLLEPHCSVVRFEQRGCGRSDWQGPYDVETTIDDAEQIRLQYGFDKWIVAGHSFGPDLALAYTIKYPKNVLGIIGISGGRIVDDRDWSATYHKKLKEVGEDLGGVKFVADPEVNKLVNRSWKEYIKRPDLLLDISQIAVPCYFINAANDIRPTWPTQQIAKLIPNAKYCEIKDAAHSIWLTHSEELKSRLQEAIDFIKHHAVK